MSPPAPLPNVPDLGPVLVALSSERRLHRLSFQDGDDRGLHVEAWAMREGVSALSQTQIVALAADAQIPLEPLLGKAVTLSTVQADGELTTRSGLIASARKVGAEGGLARYLFFVVSWLWFATMQIRSQIFQNRTVAEIIQSILSAYSHLGSWRFSGEVAAFLAEAPVWVYRVQYQETDYAFFLQILVEEGLSYRFEEDPNSPSGHVLVIFADSQRVKARPVRFHRASAQEESDTVPRLIRRTRNAVGAITLSAWSVDGKRLLTATVKNRYARPRAQSITYEDVTGLDDYNRHSNSDGLARRARFLMEAVECHSDRLSGLSTIRSLRSGEAIKVSEAPALGLSEASPSVFVDAIEHVGINNLPPGLQDDLQNALGGVEALLQFETAPHFAASPLKAPDVLGMTPASENASDPFIGLRGSPPFGFAGFSDSDSGLTIRQNSARQAPHEKNIAGAQETGYYNNFSGILHDRPLRPSVISAQGTRLHEKQRIHGVHVGVVTGPNGETTPQGSEEVYCNARGDVRLRYTWQSDDTATGGLPDGRADNRLTRWARVASYQAGPGMGLQTTPRIGQEVLVIFADGDPEQPIIIGSVYNGYGEGAIPPTPGGKSLENIQHPDGDIFALARDNTPSAQYNVVQSGTGGHAPAWHGQSPEASGHNNAAALSGFKSKEFGGQGFNQLVFDDTDQQLRVQALSSTATSQLTLGHNVHQAGNYRGSLRAEGFELRTDDNAAIRGERGVIGITSHDEVTGRTPIPTQPTGDATPLTALAKQMETLSKKLDESAKQHGAVGLAAAAGTTKKDTSQLNPDRAPLAAIRESLNGTVDRESLDKALADASDRQNAADPSKIPHFNDPLIGLAGKGGIAATAGQHLQWTASETVALGTLTHYNLTVGGRFRAQTGQAIGVLSGADKPDHGKTALDITAAKDEINVEAQHDKIELASSDTLTLRSETLNIDFASKKRIHIATEEGASITIENGNITFECPGTITYYRMNSTISGPKNVAYELFTRPETDLAWVEVESYFDDPWETPWPLENLTVRLDHKPIILSKAVKHKKEEKKDD